MAYTSLQKAQEHHGPKPVFSSKVFSKVPQGVNTARTIGIIFLIDLAIAQWENTEANRTKLSAIHQTNEDVALDGAGWDSYSGD